MTPIINPMWFYWLEVFNGLGEVLFWVGILGFVMLGLILMISFMSCDPLADDAAKKTIIFTIVFGVLVVISIFIPSEQTMYKMMLANYATTDNITEITTSIQNGVDYIFDKIENTDEEKE